MEIIQPYIARMQQFVGTQIWPQIEQFLKTNKLPTTLSGARQYLNDVQKPYITDYQRGLEGFIKTNRINIWEFFLLTVIGTIITLFVVRRLLFFILPNNQRRYRDFDDRTKGLFEKHIYRFKSGIFQIFYKYTPIGYFVDKKIGESKKDYAIQLSKEFKDQFFALPEQPLKIEAIKQRLSSFYERDDAITSKGNMSGTRYCHVEYENKMKDFVKDYIFHNPIHAQEFPGSRQMEGEIIKMTCSLFNSNDDFGVITSGGTESIMLGILAHRNYYQKTKNIFKPNIVMPLSAHVAFNKACYYYNIEPIITPLNEDGSANINAVRKAINKNTIMLVGSNPSFVAGVQDDIPALGKLAKKYNVGLHVDCCLGSFVMPFARELGAKKVKPFDFSVPGVSSISCDHHKYGMAPKGISVVMFKEAAVRQSSYFAYSEWPGGLYATATPAGSRSSAPIAGAWYAMMYHGMKGYRENAKLVMGAVAKCREEVYKNIPALEPIGYPETMVIAFKFKKGVKASIFQLDNEMHNKGWIMAGCQKPNAVHVAVTYPFALNIDAFIKDLKIAVQALLDDPTLHAKSTSGSVGLYGASGEIPDNITKEKVLDEIVDCFTALKKDSNGQSVQNKKKQ